MQTEQQPKNTTAETEFIQGKNRGKACRPLTDDQKEVRKKLIETQKQELKPFNKLRNNCNICLYNGTEECKGNDAYRTCFKIDKHKNTTERALTLLQEIDHKYILDQYGQSYLYVQDNDRKHKLIDLTSKSFGFFINRLYLTAVGKPLHQNQIKEIAFTCQTYASLEERTNVKLRTYKIEDVIFVDNTNHNHDVIKITPDEDGYYEILTKTPPLFRRQTYMQPLPHPKAYNLNDMNGLNDIFPILYNSKYPSSCPLERKENNKENKSVGKIPFISFKSFPFLGYLNNFLNVSNMDFCIIVCHVVNTFFTDSPQTTLIICGEKGSGKTFVSEFIRKIVDPSSVCSQHMPKDQSALLQSLDHQHYPTYDNLSYLSSETSDIFCRTNTGAGIMKRQYYTTDDEFIRNFMKSININGINNVAFKEDLLDRVLLVLAKKFKGNRKLYKRLQANFNALLPYFLHDLYRLLSRVMYRLPETEVPQEFRMIDFAHIGCATVKALGYDAQVFKDIYQEKINTQLVEAVIQDIFGNTLFSYMQKNPELSGSAEDLYKILKDYAKDELSISTSKKAFPQASNAMVRKLNQLIDSLSKLGITATYKEETETRVKIWTITNTNIKPPRELTSEDIENMRNWIMENKNAEGDVSQEKFATKLKERGLLQFRQKIVQKFFSEGLLGDSDTIGAWRVLH